MIYPWLAEVQRQFDMRRQEQRMAHACLLCGPKGLGKLELAKQMVATLLCLEQGVRACGTCRSCQLLSTGAHPDYSFLTFEPNPKTEKMRTELVIEQVRKLNATMHLTNSMSPRKVALVHPAEAMNRNAANALLKTLEEPAGEAVLLLMSHDSSRLLATIRSRCQAFPVRLPDEEVSLDWLVTARDMDPDAARLALKASAGSPLRALQMVQDGVVDTWRMLMQMLDQIRTGETTVASAITTCAGLDQDDLWNWLSLAVADQIRNQYRHATAINDGASLMMGKKLFELQTLANQNRRLMATPLRKDLLLRDWLIQWAELVGS